MKKKLLIIIPVILVYSFILAMFGIFGTKVYDIANFCLTYVIPVILILFGYFLCIWLPFRIMEALRIRKERQIEYEKDKKLQAIANRQKTLEHKILEHLNNGETL